MDDERLKNIEGGGYWYELLNRIRDIRSSEKALAEYRKYQVKTLSSVEQAYLDTIKNVEKKIEGKKNG